MHRLSHGCVAELNADNLYMEAHPSASNGRNKMDFSLAPGVGVFHAARNGNHQASGIAVDEDGRRGVSPGAAQTGANAIGMEGVGLRHLKTPAEIGQILHLREAIDLSVHSAGSPDFRLLEKKETNAGSSVLSNFKAR
jgi:hypothetical protein